MTTAAKRKQPKAAVRERTGGDRLVRLTNGREYIEQANTTFRIAIPGPREKALVMTLADAVDFIKDINRFGYWRLYAELCEASMQSL